MIEKNRIMIIMEYMAGGSLDDKIKKVGGPLIKDSVFKYLVQIMEGVYFLHQNNVIHNDIKPSNILFSSDDNIKLCDFGISKHETSTSTTSTTSAKGTWNYMSPERCLGNSKSFKNDIWSVGATFVEMITGHPLNYTDSFPLS